MSEQLEDKKFTATKVDESVKFQNEPRFGFAQLLDVVSVLSLIGGVVCAMALSRKWVGYSYELDVAAAVMYLAGGCLSALWLHAAAIVVEACAKYLGRK